jgi:hypothetical protein
LAGRESGIDRFIWGNGRTSLVRYKDVVIGGVGTTTGNVVRGEFRGLHVRYFGPSIPFPQVCTSQAAGSTEALFAGFGKFGTPP